MEEILYTRDQISKIIRTRFSTIRYEKGITAQQLADKMEISVQAINQIESGKRLPSMEVLFHFCQVVGISLKEFFDEELNYPYQYQLLVPYIKDLSKEELDEIVAIIKRIAVNKNINKK